MVVYVVLPSKKVLLDNSDDTNVSVNSFVVLYDPVVVSPVFLKTMITLGGMWLVLCTNKSRYF